jgi:ATP:ADP antiporter, AAA family
MLLQKRISFSRLAVFNLMAVFSFILVIFLNISQQSNLVFIFILYIMLFPVTSIMLLSFWGLFGRIFDIRQSKRIIGGIDAGQLVATILAFVSVPFFIQYISDVSDVLIISAASIILCFVFLVFINKEIRYKSVAIQPKGAERYRFSQFFRDNYSILLSIFIGISVICVSFVDYTFLKITEQQYPDENSLATFLSYMYLAIMVFTLIMQTFRQ